VVRHNCNSFLSRSWPLEVSKAAYAQINQGVWISVSTVLTSWFTLMPCGTATSIQPT
jgi:hypothetical protein